MKRKGFTLIELLAVIVILAVIALIATPIILGLIDNSKKNAFKASAFGIAESAQNTFVKMMYSGEEPKSIMFNYTDSVESSSPGGYVLNYEGAKPKSGQVSLNADGKVAIALYDGKWCAKKAFTATDITLEEIPEEDCDLSTVSGDSIIDILKNNALTSGDYSFVANGETYAVEYINVDGNTTYSSSTNLGNATNDTKMLVVKYNGNLTVNAGVTLTAAARKKGMFLYVTGDLTNNGTITMTARGANAAGQNVYLYKIDASTYDFVPAAGSAGGASKYTNNGMSFAYDGNPGIAGASRGTGGGGSGGIRGPIAGGTTSGAGATGTSYSGGTAGGGNSIATTAGSGAANGGAGGNANGENGMGCGGGAGNPGGSGVWSGANGSAGTGGLLIIRANNLVNNGTISSNGSNGGDAGSGGGGGASGGGSINLFYINSITAGTRTATGGTGGAGYLGTRGGAGGAGTITTKQIAS